MVLGGCASSSVAPSSSVSGLRSSLAAAGPPLRLLRDDVESEILRTGRQTPTAHLARQAYTLAVAAQHNLNTISSLQAPVRYNTRLRALRSSLGALVYDLSDLSTAAGHRDAAATAGALKTIRTDAVSLAGIDAVLSKSLGLSPS